MSVSTVVEPTVVATDANGDALWWDAYIHIATFAAPLVLILLEKNHGSPYGMEPEEWKAKLLIMHTALQAVADDQFCTVSNETQEGLELFGKYFTHLWD